MTFGISSKKPKGLISNVPGSMELKFVPLESTVENSIKYFEDRIGKEKDPKRKDYYYEQLERMVDIKAAKIEGTIKIIPTQDNWAKASQMIDSTYGHETVKRPYGFVRKMMFEEYDNLISRQMTVREFALKYKVPYGTSAKEWTRMKKNPTKLRTATKKDKAMKIITERLQDILSEKITLQKLGRDNDISGAYMQKIYRVHFNNNP